MDDNIEAPQGYVESDAMDDTAELIATRKTEQDHEQNDLDILRLNIAGTIFQCFRGTLKTFPDSLLAELRTGMPQYYQATGEYFFDRNPAMFAYILDAYRTGAIHLPKDVCVVTFRQELQFWGLCPDHVAPCCWKALYKSMSDTSTLQRLAQCYKEHKDKLRMLHEQSTLRANLWLILEEPKSSKLATVWCVFMALVSVTSLLVSSLGTMDAFSQTNVSAEDQSLISSITEITHWRNRTVTAFVSRHPNLIAVEVVCFALFTIEGVVTFIIAHNRLELLKSGLRIAETVCWVAYWVAWILRSHRDSIYLVIVYIALNHVTLLRIIRLLRAVDHITAFHVMSMAFHVSRKEISAIGILLFLLSVIFGNIMFVMETLHNDNFSDPLQGMYWALITLTTVGYGDYAPSTGVGHVLAVMCAMKGIIVLALPIGIIATTYSSLYNQHKYAKKHIIESSKYVVKTT